MLSYVCKTFVTCLGGTTNFDKNFLIITFHFGFKILVKETQLDVEVSLIIY